jgi:uncharacterized protein (UPF0548 family)
MRLRPFGHTPKDTGEYLHEVKQRGFNHENAGVTGTRNSLAVAEQQGFSVRSHRQLIGKGIAAYQRAVEALASGKIVSNLPWASIVAEYKGGDFSRPAAQRPAVRPSIGDVWMTHVLSYKLVWAMSPCRIVLSDWDKPLRTCSFLPGSTAAISSISAPVEGKYSSVAFSTLQGHAITGEERFSIEWHKEGNCTSFHNRSTLYEYYHVCICYVSSMSKCSNGLFLNGSFVCADSSCLLFLLANMI